jgi:two-component system, probable response regulator PhcQ
MQPLYDYKKFAILYVDDEEKSLKYFTRAFQDQFRIFTASNAHDGFALLNQHKDEIGILMTDQRMPGERGVQLLEKARQLRPRIIRMLATAFTDFDAAVDAVNSGAIYKYVHKPWDIPALEVTLRRALEFFMVQRERDELLREKLSVLHNLMITDRVVSLGVLAAGLGHHIRNSLVAVRTFLDLAPEKLQEEVNFDDLRNPNFWRDFYGHVQKQLHRITDLLRDLGLAAEHPSSEFNDMVDLQELAGRAIERSRTASVNKTVVIENNIPASLPKIRADRYKITRFFELLLKDEILNLPDQGRISLSASQESTDQGAVVKIIVQDNGPGLASDSLRSVFDPFLVRYDDPQEFGINLMACFFLIYHHGGKIEVESQPGAGTKFTVTLPVNAAERSLVQSDRDFLPHLLANEALWEKLLAGTV